MNSARALQQEIADVLNADEYLKLHGVTAVPEDRLDADMLVDEALASVGICATVMTLTLDYMGSTDDGALAAEVPELTVGVMEAAANRERPDACTALDAAIRVAELLHSTTLQFKGIRQALEERRGLLIANATFATSLIVSLTTTEE